MLLLALAGTESVPASAAPSLPGAVTARCATPAAFSAARLAAASLVVPADESDLAAVLPEVRAGVGGVLLLGSSAPADLATELARLASAAPGGVAPWVMLDEEGGAVQRLANLVGDLPAARTLGASDSPTEIRALATTLGRRLRALGVTMDLAPVLDADGGAGPNARDADGTRSFSANPAVAAADGIAFAKGLLAGGVVPVVKHFPGLGGATGNTDLVVASTKPWSLERESGLVPFADAVRVGLPAVMVSVAGVPGLSSEPASLSAAVVGGELRHGLGFHGLVLSDSLSAVSVSGRGFTLARGAVATLAAGGDLVLYNATVAGTQAVTTTLEQAIEGALATGRLQRSTLVAAAAESLRLRGVRSCSR
ncbi:MAG TPA: glycoside hydrolase family 3 N-terminal domain-containing protein [Acidimicrobiales bacterium]|nr:glycoside hydrolase family 3 N-terminal domain-containing protein [Acidimicrobiales bacterium]